MEHLTRHEKLLLALRGFESPQSLSTLIVAAWHKFPGTFGLEDYENQYPDAQLSTEFFAIRPEWLRRENGLFSLTTEGRCVADGLAGGERLPLPAALSAKEQFAQLVAKGPYQPYDPWKEYAELVTDNCGIADASWWGFRVQLVNGERNVEFPGGLTDKHYEYFAPLMEVDSDMADLYKADLARGVLENRLRPRSWQDFDSAWRVLEIRYGGEESWIAELVRTLGFDAIENEIRQFLEDDREVTSIRPAITRHPHVQSVTISHGVNDFVLWVEGLEPIAIPSEFGGILALFSLKICHGSPREVVGWEQVHEAMNEEYVAPGTASVALRKKCLKLNKYLKRWLGRPPESLNWLMSVKRQGLQLNPFVSWSVSEGVKNLLGQRSAFGHTVDPRILDQAYPGRDQTLPHQPRRDKNSDDN